MGGRALVNYTGELEAELRITKNTINHMKLQLEALEEEKGKLSVELEKA